MDLYIVSLIFMIWTKWVVPISDSSLKNKSKWQIQKVNAIKQVIRYDHLYYLDFKKISSNLSGFQSL